MRIHLLLLLLAAIFAAPACTEKPQPATALPILGERDIRPRADGGPDDSVAVPVPAFQLTDQAGRPVSNQTLAGHAYVANFFFATCPSICPKMQSELLAVYKKYPTDPRVAFLSVTIDPAQDTIAALRDYAERLGVPNASRWHFARLPDREQTFVLANKFLTGVMLDKKAPGGMIHSGVLVLVDDHGYIRGVYDGLNPTEVARLQTELPTLLAEIDTRAKAVAGR